MLLSNRFLRTVCMTSLATGCAAVPALAGPNAYLGEIMPTAATYCPRGTVEANGQLLPIADNTALFSLLGTTYGGDGVETFALPNLAGRVPVGHGAGPGLAPVNQGQAFGSNTHVLTENQLPPHSHAATSTAASDLFAVSAPGDTDSPDGAALAMVNVVTVPAPAMGDKPKDGKDGKDAGAVLERVDPEDLDASALGGAAPLLLADADADAADPDGAAAVVDSADPPALADGADPVDQDAPVVTADPAAPKVDPAAAPAATADPATADADAPVSTAPAPVVTADPGDGAAAPADPAVTKADPDASPVVTVTPAPAAPAGVDDPVDPGPAPVKVADPADPAETTDPDTKVAPPPPKLADAPVQPVTPVAPPPPPPLPKALAYSQSGDLNSILAPGSVETLVETEIAVTGGGAPFNITQPSLVIRYCIATVGVFPSRE